MKRRQLITVVCLAEILALIWLGAERASIGFGAAAENDGGPDAYARQVRPLLDKYCFACHGAVKAKSGLNLESLKDQQDASARTAWKQVWDRIKSRQMPPSDRPQPTAAEREAPDRLDRNRLRPAHPGRPPRPRSAAAAPAERPRAHEHLPRSGGRQGPARKPRRVAYTSKPDGTVNLYHAIIPPPEHPCAFVSRILPQDTNDGGFDTIGENLSIPPFLMEKYLRCSKVLLDDMFTLNPKRGRSYQWPLYQDLMKLQKGTASERDDAAAGADGLSEGVRHAGPFAGP